MYSACAWMAVAVMVREMARSCTPALRIRDMYRTSLRKELLCKFLAAIDHRVCVRSAGTYPHPMQTNSCYAFSFRRAWERFPALRKHTAPTSGAGSAPSVYENSVMSLRSCLAYVLTTTCRAIRHSDYDDDQVCRRRMRTKATMQLQLQQQHEQLYVIDISAAEKLGEMAVVECRRTTWERRVGVWPHCSGFLCSVQYVVACCDCGGVGGAHLMLSDITFFRSLGVWSHFCSVEGVPPLAEFSWTVRLALSLGVFERVILNFAEFSVITISDEWSTLLRSTMIYCIDPCQFLSDQRKNSEEKWPPLTAPSLCLRRLSFCTTLFVRCFFSLIWIFVNF